MQRTDSRTLYERKASVTLRIADMRKALVAAERCEAEIDTQIESLEASKHAAE
jgi:hypothetical protein